MRVTVLGSLNMDISVTVPRLPEPGATVLGGGASYAPGGKGANQAVAAARLGAAVRMIGCVGDDDFGGRLRQALRDEGVADEGVRTVPGTSTGLAMITVDAAGENMITVAPGANQETGPEEAAAASAAAADALVISAEIPVAAIRAALAASGPKLRILNLAPAPPEAAELIAAGVDWLVVNESEAAAVLGREPSGQDAGRGQSARAARWAEEAQATGETWSARGTRAAGAAQAAWEGQAAREARPTGEARPTEEARLAGEPRSTSETRLAGEARATGETQPVGEAREVGETWSARGTRATGEVRLSEEARATGEAEPIREAGPIEEPGAAGGTPAIGETRTGEIRPTGEARVVREAGAPRETRAGRDRISDAVSAAARLVALGARNAVVTAGSVGAACHRAGYDSAGDDGADDHRADDHSGGYSGAGDVSFIVPGFQVRAVDSVGAGDTFVGALAVALAAGILPEEAVRAAAAAGATAATRPGTQSGMPRPADIRAATGLTWPV